MKSAFAFTLFFLATALYCVAAQEHDPIPANQSHYNYTGQDSGYSPYPVNQFQNYTQYNGSLIRSYDSIYDGHLAAGQINLNDKVLFKEISMKKGVSINYEQTIIQYPSAQPSGYRSHEIISSIQIYYQSLDGNTVQASILTGGIGYQYVKISLKSKNNKAFKFSVKIYGQ